MEEMLVDDEALSHSSPFDLKDLTDLRQQMVKFAGLYIRDEHAAEDAVQDAMVAAMKYREKFGRKSALKTWVFSILKNKVADILRQKQKYVEAGELLHEEKEDYDHDELFDKRGHWHGHERPVSWQEPDEVVGNSHFWKIFDACLNRLPENQARLFMMREFLEFETPEICEISEVTVSNLNVMLYRARTRLRECLENNWFNNGDRS